MTKAIGAAGAVLMLCGLLTGAAAAQNAPTTGQEQPLAEPSSPNDCITEQTGFKLRGKQPIFEIALANTCERRLKCKVSVYITSSKGPTQGQGSIVLAPKSKGAAAQGSYIVKTKENGGIAQSSRACRVF